MADYPVIMTSFIDSLGDSNFIAFDSNQTRFIPWATDIQQSVKWGYKVNSILGDYDAEDVNEMNSHYLSYIDKYDLARILYRLTHTASEYDTSWGNIAIEWSSANGRNPVIMTSIAGERTWGALPTRTQIIQAFYNYDKANLNVLMNNAWITTYGENDILADGLMSAFPSMEAFKALRDSVSALYGSQDPEQEGDEAEGYRSIFTGKEIDSAVALFNSYLKDEGDSNLVLFQNGHWGIPTISGYLPISGGQLTGGLDLNGNYLEFGYGNTIRSFGQGEIKFADGYGDPLSIVGINTPTSVSPSSAAVNKEYIDNLEIKLEGAYFPIDGGQMTGNLELVDNYISFNGIKIQSINNKLSFSDSQNNPVILSNIKVSDDPVTTDAANIAQVDRTYTELEQYINTKDFIINIENQQGNIQSDKTFAQIKDAFLNNKNITLKVEDSQEDTYIIKDFYYYNDNSDGEQFEFRVNYLSIKKTFILGVDNEWIIVTDT